MPAVWRHPLLRENQSPAAAGSKGVPQEVIAHRHEGVTRLHRSQEDLVGKGAISRRGGALWSAVTSPIGAPAPLWL